MKKNHLFLIHNRSDWLIFLLLVFFILSNCGSTYPDDDAFKEKYPGVKDYYFFDDLTYNLVSSGIANHNYNIPVLTSVASGNDLLFLINQRDDIYYQKGWSPDGGFKEYDSRLFIKLQNATATNRHVFTNNSFPSDLEIYYYQLMNEPSKFTNGQIYLTEEDANTWWVSVQISNASVSFNYSNRHVKATYQNQVFTVD